MDKVKQTQCSRLPEHDTGPDRLVYRRPQSAGAWGAVAAWSRPRSPEFCPRTTGEKLPSQKEGGVGVPSGILSQIPHQELLDGCLEPLNRCLFACDTNEGNIYSALICSSMYYPSILYS
ncbi:hypothetical protein AAFF_G00375020 [Aldrovandia affinis]|uniref:Uncharacterized protein n=1 Tax=Aldrovandia affinis TaxID=143900 RepID=A0AAD7WLY0_9TELE|nr:hypothetical protein AAFF_G00375020 [Aldrovandia affinis]